MNKVKSFYKIQTIIILSLILCLIVCFTVGGTASADTIQPEKEYGNMGIDLGLFAFARNGLQKMITIASVGITFDIDYIPTSDADFDYYIMRLDILVEPQDFATLKRFTMTPARNIDGKFVKDKEKVNEGFLSSKLDEIFQTGITAMDGAYLDLSEMEISLTGGGEVKMEFLSRELTSFIETNSGRKVGAPEFKVLEETGVFGNYYGVPREVRRAGRSNSSSSSDLRNDRGITYAALYYGVYQVPKSVRERRIAFRFNELEVWGQVGQPSFKLNSDQDYVKIEATWQNKFDNKTIVAEVSDKRSGQYLASYLVRSTLPRTTGKTETTFSYSDY